MGSDAASDLERVEQLIAELDGEEFLLTGLEVGGSRHKKRHPRSSWRLPTYESGERGWKRSSKRFGRNTATNVECGGVGIYNLRGIEM